MKTRKTILLKLSGEVLLSSTTKELDASLITTIAHQIRHLSSNYYFGIVIGGGNFFRGSKHSKLLGIRQQVGHQIGMLATMMNGLIIRDLFDQQKIPSVLFCAVPTAEIGRPISQQALEEARHAEQCMIFSGGTGNPFFTTDTTAVLRALQINADEVWKGTNVDGIYTKDPRKNPDATIIKHVDYHTALKQELGIMDATAFALAKEHRLKIRVFDIFKKDALIEATQEETFGSTVF